MVVGALHKQRSDKIVAQAEERVRAYIEQSPTPVFCWELASPAVVSNSLLSIAGSLERATPPSATSCPSMIRIGQSWRSCH